MDFEQQVASALHATADQVNPPVARLVRQGTERGHALRRRRSQYAAGLGAAVGVAAVSALAFGLIGRPTSGSLPPSAPSTSPTAGPFVCAAPRTDALPEWAWAGFSDPQAGGIPWVLGDKGDMVAVLFGQPLSSPEAKDHANKILWVSQHGQDPMEPLVVTATAGRSLRPAPVVVTMPSGPGPSYLDLPYPGCWHLDLSWDNGKQHDSMNLSYVKPPR